MKIVVLCGGISTEREISIISGTQVCLALRKKGHRAILLDVFCGDERIKNAGPDSFPEEYDVEAAAAYARSFDDKLEEIKKNGAGPEANASPSSQFRKGDTGVTRSCR